MKTSDGRINYLSRNIALKLTSEGLVNAGDLDGLSREIKKGFNFFLKDLEEIDKKVRSKIASIKRGIPEGSNEWDILYRQYYNEEVEKH